jgi:hypothetical protein
VDKFEYLSGLPEVGIVPRAPHVGPLLRELYEQEHGRGGFSGKVAHTYHLSGAGYTTDSRFAYRATRLAEVRAAADRWAAARDDLRPTVGDDKGGS